MALRLSLQIPVSNILTTPKTTQSNISVRIKPIPTFPQFVKFTALTTKRRKWRSLTRATDEEGRNDDSQPEPEILGTQQSPSEEPQPPKPTTDSVSELGSEIKRAMKEREQKDGKDGDFWSGVSEEVGEIEWPAFGKVLGTTWVVLGVIAGSSVVLLTVNAVLAELSDRVFAGRGVQDFFG